MGKLETSQEQQETFALLGLAVALCQEIESKFAQSILLAMTEKQRKKYTTFGELLVARDKMTFGQLVMLFKEDWDLKPEFEHLLDCFVRERNVVVHRLTILEGHGLRTKRERQRINKRLAKFIDLAFLIHKAFNASYQASQEFQSWWLKEYQGTDLPFKVPNEAEDDIISFLDMIKYKRS